MMTVGMVTIMLTYNAIFILGFTSAALTLIVTQFIPIFIAAFIIEQMIVSHNARKLHKIVASPNDAQFKSIIKLSIIMVTGMCLSMTLYTTLVNTGTDNFWQHYGTAIIRNYPIALIAQLAIVGPLTRILHVRIFKPAEHSTAVAVDA